MLIDITSLFLMCTVTGSFVSGLVEHNNNRSLLHVICHMDRKRNVEERCELKSTFHRDHH